MASVCANPQIVFAGQDSQGLDEYYADADIWNDNGGITQTMGVCSSSSWYVDVTAADHDDKAVLSYPNVHRDYHDWDTDVEPLIGSFASIPSTFAHTAADSGNYDFAYDLWLNGVADDGSTEVMIWTEWLQQQPAGDLVATVTLEGHDWDVYAEPGNAYIAFLAVDAPVTSGAFDLKAFADWLVSVGRLAAGSTLGQVGYGVEIVSTHGEQLHFDVTDFSVDTIDDPNGGTDMAVETAGLNIAADALGGAVAELSLHSAAPTNGSDELSGGSYARQAPDYSGAADGGTDDLASDVTFGGPGSATDVTHLGFWSSGSTWLGSSALQSPKSGVVDPDTVTVTSAPIVATPA